MLSTEQITKKLYKHYSGVCDTRTSRDFFEEAVTSSFNVKPDQLLMYADKIPKPASKNDNTYRKIKNFANGDVWTWQKDESTYIPVFKKYVDYPLTKIDNGTDNAFKLLDSEGNNIRNIIPFNYCLDLYNYYLTTSNGERIYFGVGDWLLDTFSGVLTFYGTVPPGVDHEHPPKITFYQYTGGTGFRQDTYGYDGATLPLENWKVGKGSYLIKTNPNNSNESLFTHISRAANKVEPGFAATYGWDGADKNEGIALSLEKIIALEYTFTKDKVKGHDDSADSEIGTLLSDKIPTYQAGSIPFSITFVSQGIDEKKSHSIKVESGQLSFDGGSAKPVNSGIIKLPNGTKDGFVVIQISDNIADGEYTFNVEEKPEEVQALLLYWNKTTQEYLPYITKEEANCNFGFTIVAINGKIPPSVTMDSAAISAYSDSITPDYYGPRNYSVTVAVEGEYSIKSADYVVKNKSGFYLDDILNRIESDFTIYQSSIPTLNFKGTVFLRAGTYEVSENIDLSKFANIAIVGEYGKQVTIKAKALKTLKYKADSAGTFLFKDLKLENIKLEFETEIVNLFLRSIVSDSDLELKTKTNNSFITESSFSNIKIENSDLDDNDTNIYTQLTHTIVNKLSVSAANVFISSIQANEVEFKERKNVIVLDNYFISVLEKPTLVQFRGCRVNSFDGSKIRRNEMPNIGTFPIYSKSSDQFLNYAEFANHFTYDEDANKILLNIDSSVMHFQARAGQDGVYELSCHLDAGQITVREFYDRDKNYTGKPTSTGKTLDGALADLYLTKADLVEGKVPLTELPDSVAYGGLLYIGSWAFDTNKGKYPTFEETIKDHPHLSLDLKVDDNKLQPGWFWVVASSTQASIDNPVSDQTSNVQYTFKDGKLKVLASSLSKIQVEALEEVLEADLTRILQAEANNGPLTDSEKDLIKTLKTGGLVFTAGDWVIWNGSFFEKLDRAYQDPVYSILPVYTTGDNSDSSTGRISWYWRLSRDSFNNGWGLGALDLGKKTIGEAFDQVNIELKRLQVKHPANISSIELNPVKSYGKTQYRKIKNNLIQPEILEAYDSLLDKSVKRFTVQSPQVDDWRNLIYFGDSGKLTGYIDSEEETYELNDKSEEITIVEDSVTFEPQTFFAISKPVDPYKNEFVGEGYFYGVKVKLQPKTDLGIGKHLFKVGVSDIKPNNPIFMKGVVGTCKPYEIEVISPYTLDNAELDTVDGRRQIVESTIKAAEKAGYCSGVKSIKIKDKPFNFTLTYRIKNALKEEANISDEKLINVFSNINEELVKIGHQITASIDGTEGFNDYFVSTANYAVQSNKVFDTIKIGSVIYDVYGAEKKFDDIFKYSIRFDPTEESERVFSGRELYPKYLPNKKEFCGNAEWDSKASLKTVEVYKSELQKVGRNLTVNGDETFISEYKWPSGVYPTFDPQDKTDYSDVEDGIEINGGIYRFVTLTKFGKQFELSDVILKDASGFTLKFIVADDLKDEFTANKYSLETNNIIIQAKLINQNIDNGDPSVTSWLDCNKPFDGFSDIGKEDGDQAMYAGSSSALVKRITFGRNTYSGKLIIRVGLKKDSKLAFSSVEVKDFI